MEKDKTRPQYPRRGCHNRRDSLSGGSQPWKRSILIVSSHDPGFLGSSVRSSCRSTLTPFRLSRSDP